MEDEEAINLAFLALDMTITEEKDLQPWEMLKFEKNYYNSGRGRRAVVD